MSSSAVYLDDSTLVSLLSAAELHNILYNLYWRLEQHVASALAIPQLTSEGPVLLLSESVTASCGLGHLPLHYRDDEVAGAVTLTRRRRPGTIEVEDDSGDLIDGVCILCSAGGGCVLAMARLQPLRDLCEAACIAAFVSRVAAASATSPSRSSIAFHGFSAMEAAKLRATAGTAVEAADAATADVIVCRGARAFRRALAITVAEAAPPSWLVFLTDADASETLTLPTSAAASIVCDPLAMRWLPPAAAAAAAASGATASALFADAPPAATGSGSLLPLPAVAVLSPASPLACLAACKFAYEKRLSTGPRD